MARSIDRLSVLPEDILEHILSFLPAVDAVRSSVLSRRWRDAWTRSPILNISDEQHQEGSRFVAFAHAVLARYGSPDIPELNVVIGCASSLVPCTAAWLRDAMERVVGSVSVTVTAPGALWDQLVLPRRLRAKSISLTLSGSYSKYGGGCVVFPAAKPGGAAPSYGALAELSLSRVQLQEHDVRSLGAFLSSCCPQLRKLRLCEVSGGRLRLPLFPLMLGMNLPEELEMGPLVLRMDLLEELEMGELDNDVVEISAPRLETLVYRGGFPKHISFPAGSQSVRRLAGLCFYLPEKESMSITAVQLLEACPEANDISVRIDVPDGSTPSSLSREHLEHVPQLPIVRVLSLQVVAILQFSTCCPIAPVLLSLIRQCPNLRWLHIDLTTTHWFSRSYPNYLMAPDEDEPREIEALPLQASNSHRLKAHRDQMRLASLREIRLSGFMGTGQDMEVADLLFGAHATRPSLERILISLLRQGAESGPATTTPPFNKWMSASPSQVWRHLEGVGARVEARFPLAGGRWETNPGVSLAWTRTTRTSGAAGL